MPDRQPFGIAPPKRPRGPALRVVGAVVVAGVLLLAVAGFLAWRDATSARDELLRAADDVRVAVNEGATGLDATSRAKLRASLVDAAARADRADARLKRSVGLKVFGFVPGVSGQRAAMLRLADDASTALAVGVRAMTELEAALASSTAPGTTTTDVIASITRTVNTTIVNLDKTVRPSSTLWRPLAQSRQQFDTELADLQTRLVDVRQLLTGLYTFLGGQGPREYVLAGQNNAEMRDQGMMLWYGHLGLDQGSPSIGAAGSVVDVALGHPAEVILDPGREQLFGPLQPTQLWQNVNATADFAWTGQTMQKMYRQATGADVDGVLAVDVVGLRHLLVAVGPVTIEGYPTPIDGTNADRVLLNELYQGLGPRDDQDERRERLGDVLHAVINEIGTGKHDLAVVASRLRTAAQTGHVRIWSSDPAEEQIFEHAGMAGGPALTMADRTFHAAVQNATATKLDWFVNVKVTHDITIDDHNRAIVDTTVDVINNAPADAAPSYQFGPIRAQKRAGEYITRVYLWGPAGSDQDSSVEESGLRLNQDPISVDPATTGHVQFRTVIHDAVRDGRFDLRLVPQARVRPIDVTVRMKGGRVTGPAEQTMPLDRTRVLTWKAH